MDVVGWGRGGPFYEGGSEIFGDLLGRGPELFYQSSSKNSFFGRGVPQTNHYFYNFRLFSLQLKDIHKNNSSSISDYFISNLTTKRLKKKRIKNLECFMSTKKREKEKVFSLIFQLNRIQ